MSPLARVLVTLFLGGFGVHKFIDGQIGKFVLEADETYTVST